MVHGPWFVINGYLFHRRGAERAEFAQRNYKKSPCIHIHPECSGQAPECSGQAIDVALFHRQDPPAQKFRWTSAKSRSGARTISNLQSAISNRFLCEPLRLCDFAVKHASCLFTYNVKSARQLLFVTSTIATAIQLIQLICTFLLLQESTKEGVTSLMYGQRSGPYYQHLCYCGEQQQHHAQLFQAGRL
jgi:hypothetical protein